MEEEYDDTKNGKKYEKMKKSRRNGKKIRK